VRLPGGNWAGERAGAGKRGDKGSVKRDEGRGTKEAGEEKEEINIIKPLFCAEGLWPADVGGDYLVNLIYYALHDGDFFFG